jgi:hypothetical protein
MDWLHPLADVASIATAIVAVYAYGRYRLTTRRRRKAIEKLLAAKSAPNDDTLTLEQIAAVTKMTIEQVIEAAASSKLIEGTEGHLGNERCLRYIRNSN